MGSEVRLGDRAKYDVETANMSGESSPTTVRY